MNYSTTDTYKMKREIMDYAKKFSSRLSAAEAKFNADMLYGMVASQSCLLTQISQRLHAMRKFMGINFFERCSQCHDAAEVPASAGGAWPWEAIFRRHQPLSGAGGSDDA